MVSPVEFWMLGSQINIKKYIFLACFCSQGAMAGVDEFLASTKYLVDANHPDFRMPQSEEDFKERSQQLEEMAAAARQPLDLKLYFATPAHRYTMVYLILGLWLPAHEAIHLQVEKPDFEDPSQCFGFEMYCTELINWLKSAVTQLGFPTKNCELRVLSVVGDIGYELPNFIETRIAFRDLPMRLVGGNNTRLKRDFFPIFDSFRTRWQEKSKDWAYLRVRLLYHYAQLSFELAALAVYQHKDFLDFFARLLKWVQATPAGQDTDSFVRLLQELPLPGDSVELRYSFLKRHFSFLKKLVDTHVNADNAYEIPNCWL